MSAHAKAVVQRIELITTHTDLREEERLQIIFGWELHALLMYRFEYGRMGLIQHFSILRNIKCASKIIPARMSPIYRNIIEGDDIEIFLGFIPFFNFWLNPITH